MENFFLKIWKKTEIALSRNKEIETITIPLKTPRPKQKYFSKKA